MTQCLPEPACWGSRDATTGPVFIWKLPLPSPPSTGDTRPQSYEEMDRLTKGKQSLRRAADPVPDRKTGCRGLCHRPRDREGGGSWGRMERDHGLQLKLTSWVIPRPQLGCCHGKRGWLREDRILGGLGSLHCSYPQKPRPLDRTVWTGCVVQLRAGEAQVET